MMRKIAIFGIMVMLTCSGCTIRVSGPGFYPITEPVVYDTYPSVPICRPWYGEIVCTGGTSTFVPAPNILIRSGGGGGRNNHGGGARKPGHIRKNHPYRIQDEDDWSDALL